MKMYIYHYFAIMQVDFGKLFLVVESNDMNQNILSNRILLLVFARMCCPLIYNISSAKIVQPVEQWIRKQRNKMKSYR